jgi:hypothetical protein
MTELTPEKRAELRATLDYADQRHQAFVNERNVLYPPSTVVIETAFLRCLLDALDAAELAAAQALAPGGELEAAERAVVDAAVAWNDCDRRVEIEATELSLAAAVDELVALCAKAGR